MNTAPAAAAAPSSVPLKTKGNVDAAIRTILTHNFDTDSTVCLTTLIKVLDNILHKPQNDKVRCLRTGNATIKSKIMDKQGHEVLFVCGFVLESKSFSEEERFVLYEHHEETAFLVNVRHTLAKTLVQDLQIPPEKVPPFRPPPLPKMTRAPTATTTTNTGFDVYQGQRFDGQAAAVGTPLGPPVGWKSKTETELAHLQRREAQITQQLATKKTTSQKTTSSVVDRHWTVVTPGQQQQQPPRQSTSSSSSSTNKDDKQLLAKHYQEQYKKKMAREQSGFTTKAMRDLAKLKKQNVYSHTQLAIAFPDGLMIKANFGTKETVGKVMEGLRAEVFVEHVPVPKLELYQTPPRTVVDPHKTLTELGLVPAAKIYVSWKSPLCSKGIKFWYVRTRFFSTEQQQQHPVRALAVPVVGGGNTTAEGKPSSTGMMRDDNNKPQKKKKTQEEKAAEMMKRMLGKR